MDDPRQQYPHPTTMEPRDGDGLVRERLQPEPKSSRFLRVPQSVGARAVLSALALLLVVAVVGTSTLVIRNLRAQGSPSTIASTSAPATVPRATPTPVPAYEVPAPDPKDNGWTQVTPAGGDIKFSASSPQRGYLCGQDQNGRSIFGVTTNGGQTWAFGPSPAAYEYCSIQVSLTNALDLTLTSIVEAGPAPVLQDAHYSIDGGKTWKAAPIPDNTNILGGALWSGAYLYMWSGKIDGGPLPVSSFLTVSANGGPFTSIDLSTLLPGAQNVSIRSAVASGSKLYLNITYNDCSPQNCQAIVASGDGGKTWTQVPNQSSIKLAYVVGAALYGQMTDSQDQSTQLIMTSADSGATWMPLPIPKLPYGQTVSLSPPGSWLPTPDGTIFTVYCGLGVAYLRGGAWTIIPVDCLGTVAAVSLDPSGQPQRIWGVNSLQASYHGIYWHAFP